MNIDIVFSVYSATDIILNQKGGSTFMSIIGKIHDLLEEDAKFFFPASAAAKLPARNQLRSVGDLPLLKLLNDSNITTPPFPLSISAIEEIGKEAGADDLKKLNSQLLTFLQTGKIQDLSAFFVDLRHLTEQAAGLLANQAVIGASLLSIVKALNPANLDSIFIAQGQYFFGHPDPANKAKTIPGFVTIVGEVIAPPALPSAST
ncbi:MAG: hypothetical protein ABSG46_14045, partial [Candidatus Binataceae bacterium]